MLYNKEDERINFLVCLSSSVFSRVIPEIRLLLTTLRSSLSFLSKFTYRGYFNDLSGFTRWLPWNEFRTLQSTPIRCNLFL